MLWSIGDVFVCHCRDDLFIYLVAH
jgi:hypothetical protein